MYARDAYEAVGGHAAIADRLHDGVALARQFRSRGFATDLFDATDTFHCRMYRTALEVWNGFAKNAHEGLGSPRMIVPATLLLLGGQVCRSACSRSHRRPSCSPSLSSARRLCSPHACSRPSVFASRCSVRCFIRSRFARCLRSNGPLFSAHSATAQPFGKTAPIIRHPRYETFAVCARSWNCRVRRARRRPEIRIRHISASYQKWKRLPLLRTIISAVYFIAEFRARNEGLPAKCATGAQLPALDER